MRRPLSVDSSAISPDTKRMRPETDKAQLYDRQLRLWHESGQTALENAHVCVFGSSALASESLKNLVLPGIGRFTVIDDATVDDQDVLANFFVQHDDAGKPRAECIVAGLAELNPDARGVAVVRAPADVLGSCESSDTDLVSSASLVMACGLPDALVHDLGLRCWQLGTPLIVASAAGFMASIRTVVPEHAVVESHADMKQDLRLSAPFPALLSHVDGIDLNTLDPTELGHVPYAIIIVKALQKWAAANNLTLGKDTIDIPYSRIREMRDIVRAMAPASDEENFVEASKNLNANCTAYEIAFEVLQIIGDAAASETPTNSGSDDADLQASPSASIPTDGGSKDKFWLMAKALRRFTESDYAEGKLPLSGAIPDMKADTKSYIALQRIYKQKADEDKAEFSKHIHEILDAAGLPQDYVSQAEIDTYCKNARRLRLLRFTPIHTELKGKPSNIDELAFSEALHHYVLFRSSGIFFEKHRRYPGVPDGVKHVDLDDLVAADAVELETIGNGLLVSWGIADQTVPDGLVAEFARSGHDELHNIASLSGGVIAQEAIKLVTHQYVPANNMCIVDGAATKIHVARV